ncbi:MAG: hypothetical protein Q4B09_07490 [Lachnospiraceae bacterium]|nr:hypothetical protein [Lachnospiraceae bacterium]
MDRAVSVLVAMIIVAAVMIYFVSPIDFFPGPIDDLLLAVFALPKAKNLITSEKNIIRV